MLQTVPTDRPSGYRLIGELDISIAAEVGDLLERRVVDGAPMSLDLSALRFMDSSGLKVIYRLARAARERGGEPVVLLSPGLAVQRLFDIALPESVPGVRIVRADNE